MLYLMENKMPYGRVVAFKVGFTNQPVYSRMTAYATHNPYASCVDIAEGTKEEEKEYHDFMSDSELFSQVGNTEWYEVSNPDLIKGIEKDGFNYLNAYFDNFYEEIANEIANWLDL